MFKYYIPKYKDSVYHEKGVRSRKLRIYRKSRIYQRQGHCLLGVETRNIFRFRLNSFRVVHLMGVETRNICVKKLIVPPKNIPCFDAHKEWPKAVFYNVGRLL